jgi:hypothetical protein
MVKFLQKLILIACIIGAAVIVVYLVSIYSMGKNFVHDKPASDEYYQNISRRIYFTTKYRGDKFDTLLHTFLKSNSQYILPDSIKPQYIGDSSCNCDCLPLTKYIYFGNAPQEIYYLTYDLDTMYAAGAGVIDIVFTLKDKKWSCTKTSKLDSAEKARIENRFDAEILNRLQ